MAFLFDKVKDAVHDVGTTVKGAVGSKLEGLFHSHTHHSGACSDGTLHHMHRFQSFAPQREGNSVKWYVDGCGYFWAVSVALEQAKHEIWILVSGC
jgi:phospholipase D1/2